MKEMKTLTLPNGVTYEIVDAKARASITKDNNDAKRVSAPPITQTASGYPIAVNNSAERPLNGLKLFGKTTQVTTTGKQLLNNTGDTYVTGGITYKSNADGSITISGTATGEAYYLFDFRNDIPIANTELIASISGSSDVSMVIGYFTDTDTFVNDIAAVDSTVQKTFSYPSEAVATRTFLAINTGKTVNATVYPLVRLASVTDDTYEPYSGGVASPSPDWPQDLNSVENPTVSIFGKNLIECPFTEPATRNGITLVNIGDGGILVSGTASAYTEILLYGGYGTTTTGFPFNTVLSGGTASVGLHAFRYDAHKIYTGVSSSRENAITVPASPGMAIAIGIEEGKTVLDTIYPMLTAEGMTTEPEKYKTPQTLALTRTLPGIPVISNGNYTDSNGQQWICDEIDFERGVYIQRVKTLTLDGSISFGIGSGSDYFYIPLSDRAYGSPIMCDKLSHASGLWETTPTWWADNPDNNVVAFVGFMDSGIATTVAEMVAYTTENPITIQYILAIPVETALTEEELAAFEPLYSHSTSTTVLNDSSAWMEMKYSADFDSYADTVIRRVVYEMVDASITQAEIQAAVDNWLNAHYSNAEGATF